LAKITQFNARQIFPLYGILLYDSQANQSWQGQDWDTVWFS